MDKPASILSAALKLFVQYGFHGTPTSRIASEAGVSNGTLFHYFKTKDELVVALYNHIKEELNTHLQVKINEGKGFKEKFRNMFVYSLRWAVAHQDEYYFLQQFHFSPHLSLISVEEIAKQTHLHAQLLEEAIQANIFKNLPADLIASLAGSQINGMYQYLMASSLPAEEQNKTIGESFELIWSMIANPAII